MIGEFVKLKSTLIDGVSMKLAKKKLLTCVLCSVVLMLDGDLCCGKDREVLLSERVLRKKNVENSIFKHKNLLKFSNAKKHSTA